MPELEIIFSINAIGSQAKKNPKKSLQSSERVLSFLMRFAIPHTHAPSQNKRRVPCKATQERLLRGQNNNCFYCGLPFDEWWHDGKFARLRKPHWDHASPYSLTFNSDDENFVAACQRCNGIKGSKVFPTFEEAAKHVRQRLRDKGYPLSVKWGSKQIKEVLKHKMINESSHLLLPPDSEDEEELRNQLQQIKELRKLYASLPPSESERRALLKQKEAEQAPPNPAILLRP